MWDYVVFGMHLLQFKACWAFSYGIFYILPFMATLSFTVNSSFKVQYCLISCFTSFLLDDHNVMMYFLAFVKAYHFMWPFVCLALTYVWECVVLMVSMFSLMSSISLSVFYMVLFWQPVNYVEVRTWFVWYADLVLVHSEKDALQSLWQLCYICHEYYE